ncbi:MAG: T9SS type A sorting domain-containing protein [Flavobacteriales bacterium]|jgi:hypothetical protein|nr:T9SS type A sorting domain-containing protein [Flavobacteriales bacterium]
MRNTNIILGTLAISAIAVGSFIFPSQEKIESNYTPKSLSLHKKDSQKWALAAEYYNNLRKNVHTGQIEKADYEAALLHVKNMYNAKTTAFTFIDEGPDNVGGRTRAISVYPNDDTHIIAGAVTGGLYESTNGGNSWSRMQGWDDATELLSISSTAITNNGTIYVATGGAAFEGDLTYENSGSQRGDGLWYSTDNGASFTQVDGTSNKDLTKVTADYSQNDVVYITGTSFGAKKMVDKGSLIAITATSLGNSTSTQDVKISPDGSVVTIASASTVWSSQDGGNSFNKVTGNGAGQISGSSSRNETAVSYEKNANGNWNCYVARSLSNGRIGGVWLSEDNGVNWTRIAQQYTTGSGGVSWDPTATQGGYNLVIDAVKGFPDQCVLGGLNLYRWVKNPNSSPASGTWETLSNWAYPKGNPNYVHADNHRLTWNSKGQLIIGNDGGVQISRDSTLSAFYDANRGYNVTQFYAMGYGPDGAVIGGAQDNGTQYNNHTAFFSWLEHTEVNGGDGFECEISYLNKDAFFASIYNSGIRRFEGVGTGSSIDMTGITAGTPGDPSGGVGTFYTPLRLFEDPNDLDTQDSIMYIARETVLSGSTVSYASESFQLPLEYTVNQDIFVDYDTTFITSDTVTATFDTLYAGDTLLENGIARDTIMVPDYVQSLFVTHTEQGIYLTRDMTRYGVSTEWWQVNPVGNQAHSFEFSKDGNCLWIGTFGGTVYRVMGLDSAYSFEQADYSYKDSASYKLTVETINAGGAGIVTDISVDKDNPDKVIIVRGGTGSNHVYYSTNATSASPTWTAIDGNGSNGLPNAPVFGVEIIANASTNETVIVGTEYGAFATENISGSSTNWTPINNEIGLVPVFDVRQQWRSLADGVSNPYAVYLGTHGRGIWKSETVLSTEESIVEEDVKELNNITVYPNPMSTEGKIGFEINNASEVNINIYDLQGKIIKNINRKNLSAGMHVIPFNVQDYPSGTYIVTFETAHASEVTKFIKY